MCAFLSRGGLPTSMTVGSRGHPMFGFTETATSFRRSEGSGISTSSPTLVLSAILVGRSPRLAGVEPRSASGHGLSATHTLSWVGEMSVQIVAHFLLGWFFFYC